MRAFLARCVHAAAMASFVLALVIGICGALLNELSNAIALVANALARQGGRR
jgi:hypothetical protein